MIDRLDLNAILQEYEELDHETYTYIKEFYYTGFSIKEISEKHNINEEALRKRMYRSLCKLRKMKKRKEVCEMDEYTKDIENIQPGGVT